MRRLRVLPLFVFPAFGLVLALAAARTLEAQAATPKRADGRAGGRAGESAADDAKSPGKTSETADAGREELLRINTLFNRGLYSLALPRYEKLLETHPTLADRAMVLYAIGVSADALSREGAASPGDAGSEDPDAGNASDPGTASATRVAALREKASAALREAAGIETFAHRAAALELLAEVRIALGDAKEAVSVFRTLMQSGDAAQQANAALGLADLLHGAGDHEGATAAYRDALARSEKTGDPAAPARARFRLALSLYHGAGETPDEAGLRRLEEAATHFDLLARATPPVGESADALYMLALSKQRAGDHGAARRAFESLARSSDRARRESGLYGLAASYFHEGDHTSAVAELERFRAEFPQSVHAESAALLLGRSYLATGRARAGAEILGDLRTSSRVGLEASLWLARAYAERERHDAAAKILERALEQHREGRLRPVVERELASELLASGEVERARELLARIGASESGAPDDLETAYLQAFALHRARDHEAAATTAERLIERAAGTRYAAELVSLAAESRFFLGDLENATRLYRSLLADHAGLASPRQKRIAAYRIAECHYYARRHEEALAALNALAEGPGRAELDAAIASDPVFEPYHFLVGDCHYQARRWEPARRALEQYLAAHARTPTQSPSTPAEGARDVSQPGRFVETARFELAHVLQLAGELDAARAAYASTLESSTNASYRERARFEIGQIAVTREDWKTAEESFTRLVAEAPSSEWAPWALRYLGWLADRADDPTGASRHYARIVEMHAGHEVHAEALWLLSLALSKAGEAEKSREMLARLRREHPDSPHAREALVEEAVSHARGGDNRAALAMLESLRGESLTPELDRRVRYELAWCLRRDENLDAARKTYAELIALAGDSTDGLVGHARLELAELEYDADRFDEAARLVEPLRTHAELAEKALYRLVWCDYRLDRGEALAAAWTELAKLAPESDLLPAATLLHAKERVAARALPRAAELFRRIFERKPLPPEAEAALIGFAECQNDEGRFEEARRAATTLLREYPESAYLERAAFAAGWASESTRDLDRAMEHYRAAARGGSKTAARAQFQLGQCLVAKKRYEDAIVELVQVPARFAYDEWSARALVQVAGCFETLGKTAKARQHYEEVISRYPTRDEAKLARERLLRLPG